MNYYATKTATLSRIALAACANAMSSEETHYYLRGVKVEITPRTVTYIGCDNRVMLASRTTLGEGEPDNTLVGDFIIPADVVNSKDIKSQRRLPDEVKLESAWGDKLIIGERVTFKPIDGTFPHWRRVVPQTCDGVVAYFDPALLSRLQKAAKVIGQRQFQLMHNGDGPALVSFTGEQLFGVLMPMRMSSAQLPAWFTDPAPAIPKLRPDITRFQIAETHGQLCVVAGMPYSGLMRQGKGNTDMVGFKANKKALRDFEAKLLRHHAKLLGTGMFGRVFSHPSDPSRVIEIGCDLKDGWPAWAAFCVQNPGPHVPVVHSFEWVRDEQGERLFYVAEMERLARTLKDQYSHPLYAVFAYTIRLPRIVERLNKAAPGQHPALVEMLTHAAQFCPNGHDCHLGNWMLREDGTVVLTDPFQYAGSARDSGERLAHGTSTALMRQHNAHVVARQVQLLAA